MIYRWIGTHHWQYITLHLILRQFLNCNQVGWVISFFKGDVKYRSTEYIDDFDVMLLYAERYITYICSEIFSVKINASTIIFRLLTLNVTVYISGGIITSPLRRYHLHRNSFISRSYTCTFYSCMTLSSLKVRLLTQVFYIFLCGFLLSILSTLHWHMCFKLLVNIAWQENKKETTILPAVQTWFLHLFAQDSFSTKLELNPLLHTVLDWKRQEKWRK